MKRFDLRLQVFRWQPCISASFLLYATFMLFYELGPA